MNQDIHNNISNIPYKGPLNIEELHKCEIEFPYCSAIQFKLLQEYQNSDQESLLHQFEKASVFFPDIMKLNWQLHLNKKTTVLKIQNTEISSSEVELVNILPTNPKHINHSDNTELPASVIKSTSSPAIESTAKVKNINTNNRVNLNNTNDHFIPSKTDEPVDVQDKYPALQDEIVFEPLYSKDYFASQGIKLSDEAATNDKLGKQMKSFTQWLKSMKKINTEKLNEPDEIVDKRIQMIAESSNITGEVITESMADVLLYQGKHGKAIEMYEKLSLMNPSKSTYFASLIQALKKD